MKKPYVHRPDAKSNQTNEPIVFEASMNIVLMLASAVFVALLISGVPLKVAVISLLIVVLQTLAGGSFLSIFVCKSHLTWKEFGGVGLLSEVSSHLALIKYFEILPSLVLHGHYQYCFCHFLSGSLG